MSRKYFLSATELTETRAKVERVNTRAQRRGFTGKFELEAVPAERTYRTENGTERTMRGFEVTLTGSAPSYKGWSFIAVIEPAPAGVVIHTAPSVEEIPAEGITPGLCEHCGLPRHRKYTYLVRSEDTGEVKQVGKTCIKDFLGWDVSPVFIDEEKIEEELFQGFGSLMGRFFDFPLLEVARWAFAAVDVFGYRGRYHDLSTREIVTMILDGTMGGEELDEHLSDTTTILDDDAVNARLEIVRSALTGSTGFEANLRTILAGDVVLRSHIGIAVTVGLIYQRAVTKATQTPKHVSQWIGAVGEKITVEGKIIQAMTIDGTYGASRLVVVSVGDGDRVKMFTSAGWAWDIDIDDTVHLIGTVKNHDEYQGRKETILVRPKQLSHNPTN